MRDLEFKTAHLTVKHKDQYFKIHKYNTAHSDGSSLCPFCVEFIKDFMAQPNFQRGIEN